MMCLNSQVDLDQTYSTRIEAYATRYQQNDFHFQLRESEESGTVVYESVVYESEESASGAGNDCCNRRTCATQYPPKT